MRGGGYETNDSPLGGDVKQKRFLRGYKTKIDNFHCI